MKSKITLSICAALVSTATLTAQNDPVEITEQSGGDLVIKSFIPGKKIVIGETPITVLEKHSKVEAERQSKDAQKSGATKTPPSKADPKALELWLESQVGAKPIDGTTLIRLVNGTLFKTGTAELSAEGKKTLSKINQLLLNRKSPKVKINVNTTPALAKKRAAVIRDTIIKSGGVSAANVHVVGNIDGVTPKTARFQTNIVITGVLKN